MTRSFLTLIFVIALVLPVKAQMFSVDENRQNQSRPSSYLSIGLAPSSFNYTGENLSGLNSRTLEFEEQALAFQLTTPGLDLKLILGNQITGFDEINFMDFSLSLTNRINLHRSSKLIFALPIQLHTSLTNVGNERANETFNQTNFAGGIGALINIKLSDRITFNNSAIPGYGFTNSSGGFIGGSMWYLSTRSNLYLERLLGNRTVTIGYSFNLKSFDVDQEAYDFDLNTHSITLGISL